MAVSSRRQFLSFAVLGAGAVLSEAATASPHGHNPRLHRRNWVSVYRLSTHQRRSCGACKAHGANRFYRSHEAADADRAHPGCNCSIVTQPLPRGRVLRMFRRGDSFDLRPRWRKPGHEHEFEHEKEEGSKRGR